MEENLFLKRLVLLVYASNLKEQNSLRSYSERLIEISTSQGTVQCLRRNTKQNNNWHIAIH